VGDTVVLDVVVVGPVADEARTDEDPVNTDLAGGADAVLEALVDCCLVNDGGAVTTAGALADVVLGTPVVGKEAVDVSSVVVDGADVALLAGDGAGGVVNEVADGAGVVASEAPYEAGSDCASSSSG
jgi:hypothetical protein